MGLELRQGLRHQPDRPRGVPLGGVQARAAATWPSPTPASGPPGRRRIIRTSSGEWNAASWAVIARIMLRAAPGSPAMPDPAERAQGHADRQLGHPGVGPDEPAQRARAQRVEILGGLGLRRDQPHPELLCAGAQPDGAEIGVLRAAFPHPGVLVGGHHPPQRGRQRAGPLQRLPLRAGPPAAPAAGSGPDNAGSPGAGRSAGACGRPCRGPSGPGPSRPCPGPSRPRPPSAASRSPTRTSSPPCRTSSPAWAGRSSSAAGRRRRPPGFRGGGWSTISPCGISGASRRS